MAGKSEWPRDPRQYDGYDKVAPPTVQFTITPADADLTNYARFLKCSEECTLHVTTTAGDEYTGTFYKGWNPIPVKRVWLTGTVLGGATVEGWY